MATEEKPSRNEEEYFARVNAEFIKERRASLDAARSAIERKSHYMKCPKCGGDLKEIEYHHVKVDRCVDCKGSWLVAEHGLTPDEYQRLVDMVGRTPTFTELGIVSALWSEHCSYKHSRPVLRTLPTKAPYVLQGPGENAGVISVGDGVAVAFKIESHNHPSAVEPYQGAATGVGGILRDVFTMGARPIAMLNSLRFGSLASARVRYLFAG